MIETLLTIYGIGFVSTFLALWYSLRNAPKSEQLGLAVMLAVCAVWPLYVLDIVRGLRD